MSDGARLSGDEWKAVAKSTATEVKQDEVTSLASGVAFRIFLSLFPAVLAAVAIFSLVTSPDEIDPLLDRLRQVAPQEAVQLISDPLERLVTEGERGAGGIALAGLLGGVWAATSAAVTLMRALSRAYDGQETRNFVVQRLVALAIIGALFIALSSILALLVFGAQLEDLLLERLALIGAVESLIDFLLTAARLVGAVLILMVLFAFVYWVGPARENRPPWRWITAGAVLGVVLWLILSAGFAAYTRLIRTYEEGQVYGALGGVIVTMLWLQLSMVALLVGAELNSELVAFRRSRVVRGQASADAPPASAGGTSDRALEHAADAVHSDGQRPSRRALAAVAAGSALLPEAIRTLRRWRSRRSGE
ncbi:MAG TPA: YihY/virulence factor BrkB family protein [Egibacteraceae bacterium]|nr:YihY/virulence factor BrkB family protein [Egibacteraceae bacterium]